jgi:fatty-acyl-CoA synthase
MVLGLPFETDLPQLSLGELEVVASREGPAISRDRVDAEEDLCLLFTGGTTGLPKAARLSHRMLAWHTLNALVHEVRAGDVTITHTPMFHTGGLLVYTLPLLASGGRVVLMPRWDAALCLDLLAREEVSIFFAVPTQYQQLADTPGFAQAKLDALRFLTSGGAPLPVPLFRRWQAAHRVPFKQGFGMTEAGPGLFSMQPEQAAGGASPRATNGSPTARPGSAGSSTRSTSRSSSSSCRSSPRSSTSR